MVILADPVTETEQVGPVGRGGSGVSKLGHITKERKNLLHCHKGDKATSVATTDGISRRRNQASLCLH